MTDLAYTDTAEPRRPSLRVALSRDGFRALAFAGMASLVAGFAAAGGGYFPTAWGTLEGRRLLRNRRRRCRSLAATSSTS